MVGDYDLNHENHIAQFRSDVNWMIANKKLVSMKDKKETRTLKQNSSRYYLKHLTYHLKLFH